MKNIDLTSKKCNERIINFSFFSLFVLMVVFPSALPMLKIAFLMPLIIFSLNEFLKHRRNLIIFIVALFYSIIGFLYIAYGVFLNNPGAMQQITVMVIYPLIFCFLISLFKQGDEVRLIKIFFISSLILLFYDVVYIFGFVFFDGFLVSDFNDYLYADKAVIDNSEEYFKFTIPNIASLVYFFPFFVVLIFLRQNIINRRALMVSILLFLFVTLASGRRALLLTTLIGPVISFLFFVVFNFNLIIKPSKVFLNSLMFVLLLLIVFCTLILFFGYFDYFLNMIINIFNFESNESNIERSNQFNVLMREFLQSPLFGNGAGAAAAYSRSEEQPWAYELSYVAFLFHYGLIGFFLYMLGIIYILVGLMRVALVNIMGLPFLAAFISFMIANSTNPYLAKFDYMWVVFISLSIVVCCKKSVKNNEK